MASRRPAPINLQVGWPGVHVTQVAVKGIVSAGARADKIRLD